MKKVINLLLVAAISLFFFTVQAEAYTAGSGFLCVDDNNGLGADFQAALDDVTSTINEVRLIQGTYNIANNSNDHFTIAANHSLIIS